MKKSRKNISGGMLSYFYSKPPPKKRSSQRKKSSTNRFYSAESETEYTKKQKNRELIMELHDEEVKFIKGMNEIQKDNAENLKALQKKLSKKRIKIPTTISLSRSSGVHLNKAYISQIAIHIAPNPPKSEPTTS